MEKEIDLVYAVDDEFICADCAREENRVCACENQKKAEYETCYECYESNKSI